MGRHCTQHITMSTTRLHINVADKIAKNQCLYIYVYNVCIYILNNKNINNYTPIHTYRAYKFIKRYTHVHTHVRSKKRAKMRRLSDDLRRMDEKSYIP